MEINSKMDLKTLIENNMMIVIDEDNNYSYSYCSYSYSCSCLNKFSTGCWICYVSMRLLVSGFWRPAILKCFRRRLRGDRFNSVMIVVLRFGVILVILSLRFLFILFTIINIVIFGRFSMIFTNNRIYNNLINNFVEISIHMRNCLTYQLSRSYKLMILVEKYLLHYVFSNF